MNIPSKLYPTFLKSRGTKSKAFFALGLVCFFWGTTWIASRQGVLHMPALQMAGLRQFLGGSVYVLYFMTKGRIIPTRKEIIPILTLAFFNFSLNTFEISWILISCSESFFHSSPSGPGLSEPLLPKSRRRTLIHTIAWDGSWCYQDLS